MLITAITTYDDIREAVGASVDELSDDALSLGLYEDVLTSDLEDVALTLPSTYNTTVAVATPTDAQDRFLRAARMFATYSVAKQLTITLPMFAPREIGDGKAVMARVNDPFRETTKRIESEYERRRNRLIAAFEALGSSAEVTTPRVYFGIVSPASDPITGT